MIARRTAAITIGLIAAGVATALVMATRDVRVPTDTSSCYGFATATWRPSLAAALANEYYYYPAMSGPSGTTTDFLGELARRLEAGAVKQVDEEELRSTVKDTRIFICNDRHTYCIAATAMERFIEWLLALPTVSAGETLVLAEWIPATKTEEFAQLVRDAGGSGRRETRRRIAEFLHRYWPFPVQDRARVLMAATSAGAHVRGVGGPAPARMPDASVPDMDRFPLALVTEEESVRRFIEKDDRVLDETVRWLAVGGTRRVVILHGVDHTFGNPNGVRLRLIAKRLHPMTVLNGVAMLDHRLMESVDGPPSGCWLAWGDGCYYGPLLSSRDWRRYLNGG